ncbi:hypothetical protein [Sphingobium sp. AP50]|uniref:hypothetical protein n=1 Tax=Sphingobium sp. AP50 TaxID=1884369 RepID=UPI0015A5A40B
MRKGVLPDNWLERMMARRTRMVVAVALANKMARTIWAMMTREEDYRLAWRSLPRDNQDERAASIKMRIATC